MGEEDPLLVAIASAYMKQHVQMDTWRKRAYPYVAAKAVPSDLPIRDHMLYYIC